MKLLEIVELLDNQPNATLRELIAEHLDALGARYMAQPYATGTNLVVGLGRATNKIGVGTHLDRVPTAAGANDNADAYEKRSEAALARTSAAVWATSLAAQ